MALWILLFAIFTVIFGACILVWWRLDSEKRVKGALKSLTVNVEQLRGIEATTVLIEKEQPSGGIGRLFKPEAAEAEGRLKLLSSKGGFLILTTGMAFIGMLIGERLTVIVGDAAPLIAACLVGAMPYIYRKKHRDRRLAAIEEQFAGALDFLARSVRAGNAFSVGLELLAAEAKDPLQSEILKITREMALGAGLEDALHGLQIRVPLFEVRFFVAAVLLQRETGGNLSEVLT